MNITRRLTESLNNKYKLEEDTLSEGTDVLDKIANMLSEDLTEARNPDESLQEDFWNPSQVFTEYVNNYENWSGDEWNSWNQEERDTAATEAMTAFLADNRLDDYEAELFYKDLEDANYHTEARILTKLYGDF